MLRLHMSYVNALANLQCRRILAGASALIPSNVQAAILNEENSGELGRGKKLTKPVGGRKKNYFSFPAPHPLRHSHSRPNSPRLQRIQNGG